MKSDLVLIRIIKRENYNWYQEGTEHWVRPYIHNPRDYWQIDSWNGKGQICDKWIFKGHTEVILEHYVPEELFEI
jgi:hypothetical protein